VCGTDGTEFGCDWTRKALAEAEIGEEAREQILHRNAAAMLARVTAAPHCVVEGLHYGMKLVGVIGAFGANPGIRSQKFPASWENTGNFVASGPLRVSVCAK
jgi:hypothetical protein